MSRGCSPSQELAIAVPERVVWVVVVCCGSGQVAGSARRNSPPCLAGRPLVPGRRGAAGSRRTRSERIRPSNWTGRSTSANASRVTSSPASKTIRMSRSLSFHCPAATSRSTTSRTWSAVTAVSSSPGPRRIASSSTVHEVRPVSSAATKQYGQPGMNCEALLARPYTWQNNRSGDVEASGRNHADPSTASTIRPSTARGNGRPASAARNRATSRRPRFSPSYRAPCPRRCSGPATDPPAS